MVRRADGHNIGLFFFQQLPIVLVHGELAVERSVELFVVQLIDIAHGDHLAESCGLAGNAASLVVTAAAASHPDGGDFWLAVALLAKELGACEGGQGKCGPEEGGVPEEFATRRVIHGMVLLCLVTVVGCRLIRRNVLLIDCYQVNIVLV